jgi:hypothetical protein
MRRHAVRIRLVGNVLLALVVCSRACAAGSHSGPRNVAFVNVTVVPMDQERILAGQTVLVRGERIAAIGPSVAVKVPEGAMRVDGTGKYLMPGLVDMHVHRKTSRKRGRGKPPPSGERRNWPSVCLTQPVETGRLYVCS